MAQSIDLGRLIPQRSRSFSGGNIQVRRKQPQQPQPNNITTNRPIPRPPSNDNNKLRKSGLCDKSSTNSSSKGSKASKASKTSVLTPRFMPWAFNGISSRLLPADVEDRAAGISFSDQSHDPLHHSSHHEHRQESSGERPNSHKKRIDKTRNIIGHGQPSRNGELWDAANGHTLLGRMKVASDPQMRRFSTRSTLKHSRHYEADDDDDISTSDGSQSNFNASHRDDESKELRMDTIYGEYSDAANIKTSAKSHHERSRSADFVDFLLESEGHLYPSLLRSPTDKVESPPHYGTAYIDDLYADNPYEDAYASMEFSPFLNRNESMANKSKRTIISTLDPDHDSLEEFMTPHPRRKRSLRRRIYLLLTDPTSSIISALCTALIFVMIICSNVVLVAQTLDTFEYTPQSCYFCEQYFSHQVTVDPESTRSRFLSEFEGLECRCPPEPLPYIAIFEDCVMLFFTAEWVLRLVCFDPVLEDGEEPKNPIQLFFEFFAEPHSIMDLLAFLPYHLEKYAASHSFMSFRLLRVFRVFQLIRLGQYDSTFCTLVNVLLACLPSMSMLGIALVFGGAFSGTIVYWLEKGEWKYTDLLDPPGFAHIRKGNDGFTDELSPFRSIPGAFWWFIVTVTTVGYGK